MKRSLLFIVMAIGFVAAYVGGATFAPFNDETTATGDVTAGTLVFEGDGSLDFTFDPEDFCDELAAGETCSTTFTVTNDGSLTGFITGGEHGEGDLLFFEGEITNVVDDNEEDGICQPEDWTAFADMTDDSGDVDEFISGDIHSVEVFVGLKSETDEEEGDINRCQGATATATFTITVIQADDPHDTNDNGINGGF